MSNASAPRLATYKDLLALPEDTRGEVIEGQLRTAPSALPKHSRAMRSLGGAIGKPFDDDDGRGGPGGWWILLEVDVQFSEHDVVRPDLAGWRRERLPAPWDTRPIGVTPDWICEILSPSNVAYDRVTKAQLYAKHGVQHFWLLDPAERVLEAFELSAGLWTRTGSYDDTATARVKPFEAIELNVGALFPPKQ
jgi:Uma2 family endonuclease